MRWQLVMLLFSLSLFVVACQTTTATPISIDQLIIILKTPESKDFSKATKKLGEMGQEAASASLALAEAMQYPRHDSYMAAQALIKIGPDAKEAIPELLIALENERSEIRADAAIVLGVIGEAAQCAVPNLAQHLWDDAPEVSSSAARALDAITGVDLVEEVDKLAVSTSVIYDEDGTISEKARYWWSDEGQNEDWDRGVGSCR